MWTLSSSNHLPVILSKATSSLIRASKRPVRSLKRVEDYVNAHIPARGRLRSIDFSLLSVIQGAGQNRTLRWLFFCPCSRNRHGGGQRLCRKHLHHCFGRHPLEPTWLGSVW